MNQVENGKAFEYALAMGFKKATKASIEFNSSFQIAESFYNLFNDTEKRLLNLASIEAAIFYSYMIKILETRKLLFFRKILLGSKEMSVILF
ncbi:MULTISPECIES: hypothetical protein [unclassified Bartonella]|uniref:hypothetical protein n=1 Tax=unclassified Bartonella TaxID=2645622 RepID=UPI0035D08E04